MLLVPTGFFMVFFAQASNQRVQLGVDAAFRGRVMALWVLVFLGTNPVGAPVIGWVAEHFGRRDEPSGSVGSSRWSPPWSRWSGSCATTAPGSGCGSPRCPASTWSQPTPTDPKEGPLVIGFCMEAGPFRDAWCSGRADLVDELGELKSRLMSKSVARPDHGA